MAFDFKDPELHLAAADPRMLASLVSAAADLTLVIDGDDVIKDLSHNLDVKAGAGIPAWRGLPIEQVVQAGSRPTLHEALGMARDRQRSGRFDIRHPIEGGRDLPVQYSALRINADGGVIMMGRDLRVVFDLQSRLLANRQSMEQSSNSQKRSEAQYRQLFENTAEAMVIVDATSGKVREVNPRGAAVLDVDAAATSGRKFASLFEKSRQADIKALLSGVLASGKAGRLEVDLPTSGQAVLTADLFRAGDLKLTMVRIASAPGANLYAGSAGDQGIDNLVRNAAEAILLTDVDGKVHWVNEAFLTLVQMPLAIHVLGRKLGDFFQWSEMEQDMLLKNVDQHGRVAPFSAMVKGVNGQVSEVDLSVVAMPEGAQPGFGFVMRTVTPEGSRHGRANSDLTRTAENLVEMIGRAPMKDLVRDTTDVIERMCIEAALKLTGNNRASAARVLGLSRQALYLKMNRFGIAEGE